ncbi:TIGR04086 family membrane protein [Caldibacillus lycopersici]|uniref:TIGR04086 family membrane protein n=1 Tax=Perspicuibacillus lycopersici TaxID=1325689 RepID=A0AAE3LMW4_9BACI|nr:TIGR04086 family membrane protein [Perspicuibacillus lycopersici]MCU9613990.1 TIGR04086 family membrane protein [Perspicuibacillus lycopersici]
METRKLGSSILVGLGVIYVVAAVFSLIFSLLLTFTSLHEDQLSLIITIISFISLFIGGFVAGGRGKEKGWLLGGLTGISYTLINFLFQYLGLDQLFSMEQVIFYICFNVTAIFGGILGVNLSGGNRNRTA